MRMDLELLGVPTIGGGEFLGRRWCWRESKESNKLPKPPGMYKNCAKIAHFPALID